MNLAIGSVLFGLGLVLAGAAGATWKDRQPNGWSFVLGTLAVMCWFLSGILLLSFFAPEVPL